MRCEVLRPFTARGTDYERGDRLDTSGWPSINVTAMIEQRWIAPLEYRPYFEEATELKPMKRGPGRPPKARQEEDSDGT